MGKPTNAIAPFYALKREPPADRRQKLAIPLTLAALPFTQIFDFMTMMPLGPQLMRAFQIVSGHFGRVVATSGIAAAISGFGAGFFFDR